MIVFCQISPAVSRLRRLRLEGAKERRAGLASRLAPAGGEGRAL